VRVGFAYRLSDRGNFTMRGGYGIFYGRTPAIMTGTSITQNGIQVQTYTLTSNLPTYPNVLSAPPTLNRTPDIFVFDKNYEQPKTHQLSFNMERQFGRSWSVQAGYLGVFGRDLSRSRDINWNPPTYVGGSFADGTPVSYLRYTAGRANPAFGRITVFDS